MCVFHGKNRRHRLQQALPKAEDSAGLQAKSQRLNSSFKSNARVADLKSRAPEGAGGSSAREFTWAAGGSLRRSRHT